MQKYRFDIRIFKQLPRTPRCTSPPPPPPAAHRSSQGKDSAIWAKYAKNVCAPQTEQVP